MLLSVAVMPQKFSRTNRFCHRWHGLHFEHEDYARTKTHSLSDPLLRHRPVFLGAGIPGHHLRQGYATGFTGWR